MALELFKHNKDAYVSALSMLAEQGKAAVIHPTGTGKSFIGFRLCEDFPDKVVCWLSPSEYIFRTQIENLKSVSGGWQPDNIVFFTYAKLMMMGEKEMKNISPDYIILDEFHRCGAEMWGKGVERLLSLYPGARVLGLSATAIRYLDNQRDMADELFGGNVASEITLGEAIVRGILNPPKYVMSVFAYQKDFDKIKRRVHNAKNKAARDAAEKYLEALRRALDKADGLDVIFDKHITERTGKYLVFCSDYEHLAEMRGKAYEWFAKIDGAPHIYTAYSDDPATSNAFTEFKNDKSDHLKLLFCIDMLNEGVHVDDVSGVILFRPTVSPIIYKQQIGRALSANKNCIPVIFDIVNNIENLYSIGTVQQEMQTAVNYYRYLGESEYIVNERFTVVDEVRDAKALFEQLNETLTASWDMMYCYAKQYYAEYGNLEIPRRYKTPDGYSLGNWIFTQRSVYSGEQYGSLDEDRVKKLEDIGMVWDSIRDLSWKRFYAEAVKYKKTYGDLKVPAKYVTGDGVRLGQWIANLRIYRKSGIKAAFMSEERIEQLDKLGMIWEVNDFLWDDNYAECAKYYRVHGDLDIKVGYITPDGVRIGLWLSNQRKRRKEGKLTDEQINRLDSIGMQWGSSNERKWDEGIAEARRYRAEHGDLNVQTAYVSPTGFKLGAWLSNRRECGREKLSSERRKQLDDLGMIWKKRKKKEISGESAYETAWNNNYADAKMYYEVNGNLNVPSGYVGSSGKKLGVWLARQRKLKADGKLTQNQTERLDSINMIWSVPNAWETGYEHAVQYFKSNGNLNAPINYVCGDGYALGKWLSNQRADNKSKDKYRALSKERKAKLDMLGIVWEPAEDKWLEGYTKAKEYLTKLDGKKWKTCYVSPDGFKTGEWIRSQIRAEKSRGLPKKKRNLLESIGIVFNQRKSSSNPNSRVRFSKD